MKYFTWNKNNESMVGALTRVPGVKDAIRRHGGVLSLHELPGACAIRIQMMDGDTMFVSYGEMNRARWYGMTDMTVPEYDGEITTDIGSNVAMTHSRGSCKDIDAPKAKERPKHDIFMCSKLLFKN